LTKAKKKVLVVSQYFWPENFRVNELVLELQKRGFDVDVLTSIPNYPSGKVFPEYLEQPKKFEDYFGVKVYRVPQISRRSNLLSLLLNYISFVVSACVYCILNIRHRKYDLIFGVQLSPIFSMLPAILCKKLIGAPLYFWVLDIWPDSVASGGIKNAWIIYPLKKLCKYIYSSADILFLSSRGFESKIKEMGVSNQNIVYFPQWIEADYLGEVELGTKEDDEVKALISEWKNKVIFTFTGNIGDAQDFPSMIKGVKKSLHVNELVILLVGDGRYKGELIKNIKAEGLEKTIILLGHYPPRYMPLFYYYSHYLLISLKDIPIFAHTLPGKVQSYMSSGRPLVGMINGEAKQVINEAGCGLVAPSGNHVLFASILDRCCKIGENERQELGKLGQSYAYKNFRLESLVNRIIGYF